MSDLSKRQKRGIIGASASGIIALISVLIGAFLGGGYAFSFLLIIFCSVFGYIGATVGMEDDN